MAIYLKEKDLEIGIFALTNEVVDHKDYKAVVVKIPMVGDVEIKYSAYTPITTETIMRLNATDSTKDRFFNAYEYNRKHTLAMLKAWAYATEN